jgi:hypothetical protein
LVPCIQMELILSENTIEEPKKKGRKKKNIWQFFVSILSS